MQFHVNRSQCLYKPAIIMMVDYFKLLGVILQGEGEGREGPGRRGGEGGGGGGEGGRGGEGGERGEEKRRGLLKIYPKSGRS